MKEAGRAEFTKAMKATHTILLPNMLHYHNALLQAAFGACGYHLEILPEEKNLPEYSLPYISRDYCLPTVLILGQVLAALRSGRFQPDADFIKMKEMAAPIISKGCHTGDGWLVAAEVADLAEKGYGNILIVHPFGCLVSLLYVG